VDPAQRILSRVRRSWGATARHGGKPDRLVLVPDGFHSLVVVVVVAALAPICADLLPGRIRIPQVVLLLLAGILIGPELFDLATPADVSTFSSIGLGFLFLLAGYELEPRLLGAREGRVALTAWMTSLLAAFVVFLMLYKIGDASSPIVVGIAVTTTALGTLLPILRDNDMLGGKFGRYVFGAGAVGEMGPILAMAILLGSSGSAVEIVALALFLGVALLTAMTPRLFDGSRVGAIILAREHATSQTTLRIAIAVLFVLLLVSNQLGFDSVLGAFVAGMLLRAWSPGEIELLEVKLDAIAYGFFIPIFFIYSGMTLNVAAIVEKPLPLFVFLALMLLIRGLPALFWYRNDVPLIERWQLVFLSSTALPLLVALTEVGVNNGRMTTATQAAIIGAGVLSVLVFPIVAIELEDRKRRVAEPS
jgi:Kef-type K+ transport system membrane component KefB